MIVIERGDALYPSAMLDLPRPPDRLWVHGDPALLSREAVAIVGTRRMTSYGERIARELSRAAVEAGLVVVSGLAAGIDCAAHAAALDAGGPSIAVLGEGLDAFSGHGFRRRIAGQLRERGCVVSQYQPLWPAQGWMFAQRNATIAALARAVIVVEAPLGSGALITAERARELGRPVYAVPGAVGSFTSAGANELIAAGLARLVSGPATLGWTRATTAPSSEPVLEALAAGPLSRDALPVDDATLARLVLSGAIVALPDGRLARV